MEDYETIIYNQVITIPLQAQQQRELDKKKKKHEGRKQFLSNAIIAEEIQTLLHNIAIRRTTTCGQCPFSFPYFQLGKNAGKKMEGIQSMIENKLFTKGLSFQNA